MARDVVVTGVGALTPLGGTAAETWERLCAGDCGLGPVTRFDPAAADLRAGLAGEVSRDPAAHPAVDERRMARFAQLAVPATAEALTDAGVGDALADDAGAELPWNPDRVGVCLASGLGGQSETAALGGERPSPSHAVATLTNMAAGHLGVLLGVRGPTRSPATACAAGAHAVADAVRDVAAGRADVMLAGGSEAPVSPVGLGQFDAMRALSTVADPADASRPFDADRNGFVASEGAGVL
ncbi:MAG: beta-ketoacyl synthase N-terminal-like domain-containing protein, partial [Halobacteriaceae archaeon]